MMRSDDYHQGRTPISTVMRSHDYDHRCWRCIMIIAAGDAGDA